MSLFHSRRGMRNPFGAFNLSRCAVWDAFGRLVVELESVIRDRPFATNDQPSWFTELLGHHQALLYNLAEYNETCRDILAGCFITQDEAKKNPAFREFERSCKQYRGYVGEIVNAVKHQQARFRSVVAFAESMAIVGYYIESARSDGTIGPNEHIHRGGIEAFAIARELQYHLFGLFHVANELAKACLKVVPELPDIAVDLQPDPQAADVIRKVSALESTGFPREMRKKRARIGVLTHGTSPTDYELEYPATSPSIRWPSGLRVSVGFSGDGISRNFKIPIL